MCDGGASRVRYRIETRGPVTKRGCCRGGRSVHAAEPTGSLLRSGGRSFVAPPGPVPAAGCRRQARTRPQRGVYGTTYTREFVVVAPTGRHVDRPTGGNGRDAVHDSGRVGRRCVARPGCPVRSDGHAGAAPALDSRRCERRGMSVGSIAGSPAELARLGDLRRQLIPAQRQVERQARFDRGEVLMRFARLMPSGRRPMVCKSSPKEESRTKQQHHGKVIYPDQGSAEACAVELQALGALPMRAYLCPRSTRGHFHLTSDLRRDGHRPSRPRPELTAAILISGSGCPSRTRFHVASRRMPGHSACAPAGIIEGGAAFRLSESTIARVEDVPEELRCRRSGCRMRWPSVASAPVYP